MSLSKSDVRASKRQNAERYAPRVAVKASTPVQPLVDQRLRRIAVKLLDDMKMPGVAPSVLILAALEEAKALGLRTGPRRS